jgi:F-type H+-transporting ATPase subunit delta
MGILANHVPSIEQLNPGVIEVVESAEVTKKFFGKLSFICQLKNQYFELISSFSVSGGFATINPDSTLNVNAVEAFSLEELSLEVMNRRKQKTCI